MASSLASLNGASQIFSTSSHHKTKPITKPSPVAVSSVKKSDSILAVQEEPQPFQAQALPPWLASRRASLGFAMATIFQHLGGVGPSQAQEAEDIAENNGWWVTVPLPVPTVTSKIANKETGTRSFLRTGIYQPNIGTDGSVFRLKHYAFDLLALGDLLAKDAGSYVRKYLRLRSTVMYYDFDKVISAAPDDQKQPLTDLANRLFDNVEKLQEAVEKRDDPLAQSCYSDTSVVLKEVMEKMTKKV